MTPRTEVKKFLAGRNTLNLMVLDFDGCTYLGKNSEREDGLNQSLIDESKKYDAVIFISHRAYHTYQLGLFKNNISGDKNWMTENIVNNFKNETHLICLGVSSPDDLSDEFSQAYRGVTEGKDFKTTHLVNMPSHYLSKNPQLVQIIDFILSHSPTINLNINYYDDHQYLLTNANTLVLAENVTLNCFLTKNTLITQIENNQDNRSCAIM